MNRRDYYTGLFLLISGALLLAAYLHSSLTHFSRNTDTYYADGTDISGLEEGSDVEMGGYKFGTIKRVRVRHDPTVRFELELSLKREIPIPKGTKAAGSNHSLSGARFLDLRPPAGGGETLPPGSRFPVEADPTLQEIMTKADHAFANMTEVTAQLDKLVATDASGPGLRDTFARLAKAIADADAAANSAGRLMARLDHTVGQISPPLVSGVKSLEGTMQNAQSAAHRLDRLLEKEEPALDEVLKQASARLSELKGFSEVLAGYDAERNPAIRSTLQHLDGATRSLEDLLADVKAHPWKLVRKGK